MACASYELINVKSLEEEEGWQCQYKHKVSRHRYNDFLQKDYSGPAYPPLKHKITKESLWIYGFSDPSWVSAELTRRGLMVPTLGHHGKLCETAETALLSTDESSSFFSLLKACAKKKDLLRGAIVHADILKKGLLEELFVDALVFMYVKCGALVKANALLYMHTSMNVFSWTAVIAGYSRLGQGRDALSCFERMQHEGISPDAVTFACVLKACGSIKAKDKGEQVHDEIVRQGLLGNDLVLGTALVDMYVKCGDLPKAQQVLEKLPSRDVVMWSALIAGYAQQGQGQQALNCYEWMRGEGLSPDSVTFMWILKACGSIGAVDKGERIHDEIARHGLLRNDIVLGNALVDMYSKCSILVKAQEVFEELPIRDVVSWNTLIAGYAQQSQGERALKCFDEMQSEGISPDAVTFTCILKACGSIGAVDKGEQIHKKVSRQGLLEGNVILGNALVDMYAKCGSLTKAQRVLEELRSRDVVSWNGLIDGYTQQGQGEQALKCFDRMQREGLSPNAVTFACILKACGTIGAVDKGELIHDEISRQGLLGNNILVGTALMDMYIKCGALSKAQQVLDELPFRDVICWSALIAGYAEHGQGEEALNCFEQMQQEGLSPDAVTFACILKACGIIGAVDKGEQIHDEISRQGLLTSNIVLGNALVDMYAKCGALSKAQQVLEDLPCQGVVPWNALIAGYTQQGQGEQALKCFEQMQRDGRTPDAISFSSVLNACSHLGLVEDAHFYFMKMSTKYGIEPNLEHYTCMVDLFGRAGHLDKAVRMIQEMPSFGDSAVWCTLLGACRKWGDVSVGKWAFEQAVHADKIDVSAYVLMANIYADAGMWEDAECIEAMRMKNKVWKKSGCSQSGRRKC